MTIYHAAIARSAPTVGTAVAMIHPNASDDVWIKRIIITNDAATAFTVGLIRTLTTGTITTQTTFQAGDPARPAGLCTLVSAWSAQPTIAGSPIYLRQYAIPATAGAGIEWVFEPWELVAKNGATTELLIWAITAGPACRVNVTLDE